MTLIRPVYGQVLRPKAHANQAAAGGWGERGAAGMCPLLARSPNQAVRGGCDQYLARPPDMSNTAPVLKRLASVHSHATNCATSFTEPNLFMGLSAIIALTASVPRLRIMAPATC